MLCRTAKGGEPAKLEKPGESHCKGIGRDQHTFEQTDWSSEPEIFGWVYVFILEQTRNFVVNRRLSDDILLSYEKKG